MPAGVVSDSTARTKVQHKDATTKQGKVMRSAIALVVVGIWAAMPSLASDHYVNGYTRANGTYVQGHYQTDPNSTKDDNYSTRGNENPYTGEAGTKPRDEDGNRQRQRSSDGDSDDDGSGNN